MTLLLLFLLASLSCVGLYLLLQRRFDRSDQQAGVRRLSPEAASPEQDGAQPLLFNPTQEIRSFLGGLILERLRLGSKVQRLLDTADVSYGPVGLVHRMTAAFLGGSVAGLIALRHPLIALGCGALAACVPILLVRSKANKRIFLFEEQFPDCLEFLSRSMRAGHAFSVSLEMVHKEFPEPLASEFRRIFEEQNLGQPLDIVLRKLTERIPSLDAQFFVSAVLLQKKTGGNLAELLDKLAGLIRERFKLRGRIRAISAQGLMSGRILAAIPVCVGVIMFIVNREYAQFFFNDPAGLQMLALAVGMQVLGYVVILKMVKIEV